MNSCSNHHKTLCKDCEKVMGQCRCMAPDKSVKYEICDECLTSQTADATKPHRVDITMKVGRQQTLAFTDMPFEELGDTPHEIAPIRQIELLAYDGDKYVTARHDGTVVELKAGYVYTTHGRCGGVPTVSHDVLDTLPFEYDGTEPTYVEPEARTVSLQELDGNISDAILNFMEENEDEDLPRGMIEDSIKAGRFTSDELAERFKNHVKEWFK